jgi:hypothetical protein
MSDEIQKNILTEIRARHEIDQRWRNGPSMICPQSHDDRGWLLSEIERLRVENNHLRRVGMDRPSAGLHKAAMAELRSENQHLREHRQLASIYATDARAKADKLRAENERLRARVGELTDALIDARHNGLIYWSPMTERGAVERAAMMSRIDKVLNKEEGKP